MRMSAQADAIDGYRQRVGIADDKVFFARGNVQTGEEGVGGRHLNSRQRAFGGFFREIKTDQRLLRFRFAGGMEMILNDQVRSLWNMQPEALREVNLGGSGFSAGFPSGMSAFTQAWMRAIWSPVNRRSSR